MAYSQGGNNDTTTPGPETEPQQPEERSRETEPEMTAYLQARSAADAGPTSPEHPGAASTEADEQPEEREMPRRAMDQ
jgi:hypothetical protein